MLKIHPLMPGLLLRATWWHRQTPCIVLEVGVCQPVKGSLGLLAKKNQWFAQFPSVQCVVLIKVDTASRRWKFLCSVWERSPLYPHGLLAYHQDVRPEPPTDRIVAGGDTCVPLS